MNPLVRTIAIIVGVLVAFWLLGTFFVPKDKPVDVPTANNPHPEQKQTDKTSPPDGPYAKLGPKAVTTPTGLKYEDLVPGTGAEAKNGKNVDVHYTGWLTDGTKFDSSKDKGQPYNLSLPGQVIPGWNEGIPGMKVGGKRKLVIPPGLGYGEGGSGPIPPNATLVFEIELLKVN